MHLFALVSVFVCFLCSVTATGPNDEIVVNDLPGGTQSLYIKSETYKFSLLPKYWVPLQMNRHVIYTSSTAAATNLIKRVMSQKRSELFSLAPEDHELLSSMFNDPLPSYVKVDSQKKRSVVGGERRIELAPKHYVFFVEEEYEGQKRSVEGLGPQAVCLHVPFFTTCDNSVDLAKLKSVMQQQNDALRAELDSYKKTNDARDRELVNSLNKQRELVQQLAQQQLNSLALIQRLSSVEKTNLVQTQHGDNIIHAQVNALKRVTNSLLRFDNALGSTDPRAMVAQPSLSKLFLGYKKEIDFLQADGYTPILDTRTFNFTEQLLPNAAVKNVTETGVTNPQPDIYSFYRGFYVVLGYTCPTPQVTADKFCNTSAASPTVSSYGWMLGPFHTNHYGIYNVLDASNNVLFTRESGYIVPKSIPYNAATRPGVADTLYCVNFLGFPMLTNFPTTPNLLNGATGASMLSLSACNSVRIFANSPTATTLYREFVYTEGITVPFYSNCPLATLQTVGLTLPSGYMSGYPTTGTAVNGDTFTGDVVARHYVSESCFLSLEPEWIGMTYYVNPNVTSITNIPRGYRTNQFTINPAGELASSLEFVYTPQWALAYTIQRTSDNRVVVDEADVLDGDTVLLVKQNGTIIDESDSFYGLGNNGRDCIQVPIGGFATAEYDFDLSDCFFQNDNVGHDISQYLNGMVRTSGISRYIDKFNMQLFQTSVSGMISYDFWLTPKPNADFRFYIVQDPVICPKIVSRSIRGQICSFNLFYSGNETVTFGGTPLTFTNQNVYGFQVSTSSTPYVLQAGPRSCMSVNCRQTVNSTYLVLETPSFSVVSQDDKNLETVTYTLDTLVGIELQRLREIDANASAAKGNIDRILNLLATIDFNVSKLFPYEDFTSLRKKVDAITARIGENYCSSPFESVQCWFKASASVLIAVAVVVVVVAIVGVVCYKTGYAKKLKAKMFKPSAENCELPKDHNPTMDFELTHTS